MDPSQIPQQSESAQSEPVQSEPVQSEPVQSEPVQSEPAILPDLPEIWQTTLHWQPTSQQQAQFQYLYAGVLTANQQLNLTRITAPQDFWEKHLWDSLRGIQSFLEPECRGVLQNALAEKTPVSVIDIGTGAGFPGIPVAIAQPTWIVTLLDSTRKKIDFLNQLLAELAITNAKTLVERVEQLGQQYAYRASYDLALVRAVAAATVCAEYALPLLKLGGLAVLYRGQWTEAEAIALDHALELLGGKVEAVESFTTPISASDRHCLYLRKVAPTPFTYPRPIGIPSQKPLP